jgi:hypothetical protein
MKRGILGSLLSISVVLATALVATPILTAEAQAARWNLEVLFIYYLKVLSDGPYWGGPIEWDPPHMGREYARYVPGEPANMTFQIINKDCSERSEKPYVKKLGRGWVSEFWPIIFRADDLNRTGFITKYRFIGYVTEIRGNDYYGDWEITIYGYCISRPIYIESVTLWFDWPGIGRSHNVTVIVNKTLYALDPINYIFKGDLNDSFTLITARFDFPPNVPPDSLGTQPTLTVRMRYPDGSTHEYDYIPSTEYEKTRWTLNVWGLKGTLYGRFFLQPFRTFDLKITDYEGGIALPGAKIELSAQAYNFSITAIANENGIAKIWRLPDKYTYRLTVNYTVPWLGSEEKVLKTSTDAYKLVSSGELRTELYTLRISPRDRQGRTLNGAPVIIESLERSGKKLENVTKDGYATFHLVPTGNYTVSVGWKGMNVFKGHRYVGYHPTLGFQSTSFDLSANVDDLVVAAVDMAGNPVGAVFSVEGPTAETSRARVEAADGVLRLEQMPVAEYLVKASNSSKVFGVTVEGSTTARPGERAEIRLPLFGVSLRALSMDGKPLQGSSIRLHGVTVPADSSGKTTVPGVPPGSYDVEVIYKGVTVYKEKLEVKDNVYRDLECAVYDVSVRFVSADGEPKVVLWNLGAEDKDFAGTGDRLAVELLPEREYKLTVIIRKDGKEVKLLEQFVRPSELRDAVIRLPLGRLVLRIVWDDGSPFEGRALLAGETKSIVNGMVKFEDMPFGTYDVALKDDRNIEILKTQVTYKGGEETIRISSANIVVKVSDILGRPIEGTVVRVQSQKIPGVELATATIGPDGTAKFTRLPATLAPFIASATYGDRTMEKTTEPGEVSIIFPVIAIGGTLIDAWIFFGIIGLVVAGIAVPVAAKALSKRKAT